MICKQHNKQVQVSTGICGSLTFGHGDLDDCGYWSEPCSEAARQHEVKYPKDGACWPFSDEVLKSMV